MQIQKGDKSSKTRLSDSNEDISMLLNNKYQVVRDQDADFSARYDHYIARKNINTQ